MKFLVNGVSLNEASFKAMVCDAKSWNESLEEVMNNLIIGGKIELSGDTYEIA